MKNRLLHFSSALLFPLFFLLFTAMSTIGQAQNVTITTDKDDYFPGEYVIMDGTGWIPGDVITLTLTHIEPNIPAHDHEPIVLTAGEDGTIHYVWLVLDQELNTTFLLSAQSLTEITMYAETTFTDSQTKNLFESALINGTSTICNGENSTLSLVIKTCTKTGTGDYTISSYKWEKSSDNINWTAADGTNNILTYSASPNNDTYYHCIITLSKKQDNCDGNSVVYTTPSFELTVNQLPTVNCPTSVSASSCSYANQVALNTAFAAWLATASATNGTLSNNSTGAPNFCGGTKTVTFTSTSTTGCGTATCNATFTITAAPAVAVTGPASIDATSCTYTNQAAVDAAFAEWKGTFAVTEDGCGVTTPNLDSYTAPDICAGGTVEIVYSIADKCTDASITRHFTITAAPAVAVTGPASIDATSCTYTNQAAVDAAFAEWKGTFAVTEDGCGVTTPNLDSYTAPDICAGGTVEITYSIADKCTSASITRHFIITPAPAVAVSAPADIDATSCTYATQAAVNDAFATWIGQFAVTEAGCGVTTPNLSSYTAPDICAGGTVEITYSIADKCTSASITRHFIITPAPAVAVTGPAGVSKNSCDYAAQTDVDASFAAWIADFKVTQAGCGILVQTDISKLVAPDICKGGTVAVKFDANDKCTSATYSASFVITPAAAVTLNVPADMTSDVYMTQAEVDAIFVDWLSRVSYSGGCNAVLTNNSTGAPDKCGGSSVVAWTVKSSCQEDAVKTATFTVPTNEAPVVNYVTGPTTPISIGSIVKINTSFTDLNAKKVHVDWDDNSSNDYNPIPSSLSPTHLYTVPGVNTVTVSVTDVCELTTSAVFQYAVIYDPNGGFVTGGGWFNSPACAFKDGSGVSGKANFGFVAKYKKGSTIPDGNTEFQFKAGNINFNSSAYDNMRLVIAGYKANYTGTGKVNGAGNYGFLVSAIDGDIKGDRVDKFRIKIWDKNNSNHVIYDNNCVDIDDNADPATAIDGGSIVIHNDKLKSAEIPEGPVAPATEESACTVVVPNGFSPNGDGINDYFRVPCIEKYPDAKLLIYSGSGAPLYENDHYGNTDFWGSDDAALWNGNDRNRNPLPSGSYIYILDLDHGRKDLIKTGVVFISR
jgi:gliding motility-associated-like protein